MHELSLLQALVGELEGVVRRYGARRVIRFRLEVGELANVVPELLEEAFNLLQEQIPWLSGAVMQTDVVPVRLACKTCGYEGGWAHRTIRCPACTGTDVRVLSGEELRLREVELDVPSPTPSGGKEP